MLEIYCNKIDRTHLQNHLKKALTENTIIIIVIMIQNLIL